MIATVTLNPAVDHTIRLDAPLEGGRVQRTRDAHFDAGGKGINVSKYLDSLGTETLATGISGGFLGSYVTDRLARDGISHEFVPISGQIRLNTTILADAEYKINHAGPDLDAEAIEGIVAVLAEHDPETVVVAGSLPPGLGPGSIDRIARAGAWWTVVDLGGEVLSELDEEYALCKPNREELGVATGKVVETPATTGVGKGIAIPHAQTDAVSQPSVAFCRSEAGLDFDSMDEKPAHLIFEILVPEGGSEDHLTILSSLSRSLMHDEVREGLYDADRPEEVQAVLREAID